MKRLACVGIAIIMQVLTFDAFAQKGGIYQRFVVDEQSRPLDYFNVIVKNQSDSSEVRVETFLHGKLELRNTLEGRKLVQIQSLGYEDLEYVEDFFAPSTSDTLVMRVAAVEMDAVVVAGRVPAVSTSHGKTVVRVAGSSLANMPEVTDILRRAPSLKVDEGGLSVFGKGTPQIFIDERESSYAELSLLQPQQIASIEVDSNPSARYDASFSSVVRVKTVRAKGGVSGQIANHSYFGRRYSNATAAQLQIAGKRWVNYFSYQYTDQTQHNYVNDTEAIHLPGSELTDETYTDVVNASRLHSVLYGSTFDINPEHQLSWQYSGAFAGGDANADIREKIVRQGEPETIDAIDIENRRRSSHSANLRYHFAIDSVHTLEITADYARSTPRGRQVVFSADEVIAAIDNRSMADVFSAKAEYSTPLWGADLLAGLRYGHIDSRTTSIYNVNSTVTDLLNDNLAAYATLGKDYKKWGWSAGLRGEFLRDDIREGDVTLRDGWENNLFPSLAFYTSGENVELSLSYTSRIERPSVSQLNPAAAYINSVVTGHGNPLLRSTISHNLEFGATLWSNLSLSIGANFYINPSINAGELSEDSQSIVFKPLNIARSRTWLVDATYNSSWGIFSMTLNGGAEFPHAKIPYLGEMISVGKPSWYASINTDLKVAKNTSLTAGFEYYGRSYSLMTEFDPTNYLSVGVTQYLFNRRLQLSLTGSDLLRGSMSGWRDRFGFYETSQAPSYDTRRVRFSVRWLFNNHKSRYNARGNSEEYNRLN